MEQHDGDRTMSLLDSYLEGREDLASDLSELVKVPVDYVTAYLETPSPQQDSMADKAIRSKTEQLLDAFLAGDNERPSFNLVRSAGQDYVSDESDNDSDGAEQLDDSYFTETLARIYLKQRRYGKALEIIRSLYLNFPNKSIYFADQIRYLDKLVRINQK
ncbi:MAG: hypothetical protein J6W42_06410 [Bacteroidaceae bacterium]|nr:hypothetical protein [Bacteroidaceae bacterium]